MAHSHSSKSKGADIWIDPATWMIKENKIAQPDEEGFENGRLSLAGVPKVNPAE